MIIKPIQLVTIPITTTAGGAFSTTITSANGRLLQYRYVPDGTTPLDTGADLTVAGAVTGFVYVNQVNIGTAAFQKLPRFATQDEQGVASLFAVGGEPVEDYLHVGGEQLNVIIAQGGASKKGTLWLSIG